MSPQKENVLLADIALLNYIEPDELSADLIVMSMMKCKWLVTSSSKEQIKLFLPTLHQHKHLMGDLNQCSIVFVNEFIKYEKLSILGELG